MKSRKIFLIIFPLLIFPFFVWKLNIFSIEKIDLVSNIECATEENIKEELNSFDKNWWDLGSGRIQDKLKNKYLCIKDVEISYGFPRTMKITIYGRKFLTKVFYSEKNLNFLELESSPSSETALIDWSFPEVSSGEALVVDTTGFIYTKKPFSFSIPALFLSENLSLGKQLDIKKFNALEKIVEKYSKIDQLSQQKVFKIKIYDNALLIDSSPKVVFSLERDILKQLASLQLILQKAKIDQRTIEIIDLRFDKPVIEYQPKLSK